MSVVIEIELLVIPGFVQTTQARSGSLCRLHGGGGGGGNSLGDDEARMVLPPPPPAQLSVQIPPTNKVTQGQPPSRQNNINNYPATERGAAIMMTARMVTI